MIKTTSMADFDLAVDSKQLVDLTSDLVSELVKKPVGLFISNLVSSMLVRWPVGELVCLSN